MATLDYGYDETGVPPDFATIATDSQRAYIPDPLTSTVIFYEMVGRFGRLGSSTPSSRMGIGDTTNNLATGSPDELLGYTASISPSTQMATMSAGAFYTRSLLTPVLGRSGRAYAIVLTSANASLGLGMIQSNSLPSGTDNHKFYTRSNGSSIPTDPIAGSGAIEGHFQVWARGEINVKPAVPTDFAPLGNVASTDMTPLFESDFFDDNITLPNGATFDYVNQVQIAVRRVSDGVSFWSHTYTATTTERDNHRTSIEYNGTTLVAGIAYEWQIRHSDRAGLWSDWSAWNSFTINPGGTLVVTSSTPTGKQNSQTPGPFVAQWTHLTPLNAKAARVVLYHADGSIHQAMSAAGFTLGAQVTNGNNISLTWANTGFTSIPRGFNGYWQMQAQDTANAWSPLSASVPLSVNATPSVPTGLSPSSPWTSSSLPLIQATGSDADNLSSTLALTVEIKRADTTTVTRSLTYNGTTGKHEYQVIATDVQSAFQTWQWRVKASDGTSESAYTGYQTFVYGAGPTVAITSPTDEQALSTASHRITWNVSANGPQVKRRVFVYEVDAGNIPVLGGYSLDTTLQANTDAFYDVSNLRNGKRYEAYVQVENSTPLLGSSLPLQFTTSFTPPVSVTGFTADPIAIHVSTGTDAVFLSWDASIYPATSFQGFKLYRTVTINGVTTRSLLRTITSPAQTSYLDMNIPSGVSAEYELYQTIRVGLDDVTSASVLAMTSIDISHMVISSALFPDSFGLELRVKAGAGTYYSETLTQDRKKVRPIGGVKGRSIVSAFQSWDGSGSFELLTDGQSSAEDKYRKLNDIVGHSGTLTLRDFTGLFRFVTLDGLSVDYRSSARYTISPKFSEEYFVVGEA